VRLHPELTRQCPLALYGLLSCLLLSLGHRRYSARLAWQTQARPLAEWVTSAKGVVVCWCDGRCNAQRRAGRHGSHVAGHSGRHAALDAARARRRHVQDAGLGVHARRHRRRHGHGGGGRGPRGRRRRAARGGRGAAGLLSGAPVRSPPAAERWSSCWAKGSWTAAVHAHAPLFAVRFNGRSLRNRARLERRRKASDYPFEGRSLRSPL
jgi:hypothetical protein